MLLKMYRPPATLPDEPLPVIDHDWATVRTFWETHTGDVSDVDAYLNARYGNNGADANIWAEVWHLYVDGSAVGQNTGSSLTLNVESDGSWTRAADNNADQRRRLNHPQFTVFDVRNPRSSEGIYGEHRFHASHDPTASPAFVDTPPPEHYDWAAFAVHMETSTLRAYTATLSGRWHNRVYLVNLSRGQVDQVRTLRQVAALPFQAETIAEDRITFDCTIQSPGRFRRYNFYVLWLLGPPRPSMFQRIRRRLRL